MGKVRWESSLAKVPELYVKLSLLESWTTYSLPKQPIREIKVLDAMKRLVSVQ